jgi:hypothetical protein
MLHRLAGLALAVLALLVPASLAAAAPVTVRVEGAGTTLLPTTPVNTRGVEFTVAGGGGVCSGTTIGGAIQLATNGQWGGHVDPSLGQEVETILGVTHPIGAAFDGRFWSIYVNDKQLGSSVCAPAATVQAGDEVLVYEGCGAPGATACFAGEPLDLKAPPVVRAGVPFTVSVGEVNTTFGPAPTFTATSATVPSVGATVSAGNAHYTTDGFGRAAVTITTPGTVNLTATKGDRARESVPVCVTTGTDGLCGTAVPPDRTAPITRLLSPRNGRTYRFARFSPRLIQVSVAESGSGVQAVKLRLTRRVGKRCFSFSGTRERFIGAKCGGGFFFTASDRASFSFLLPERLPRGHYVLDAVAVDRAFNRDAVRERGRNRSVFDVR